MSYKFPEGGYKVEETDRQVAANLRLNPLEAGVLDAALRYYVDTLVDPNEADDEDRVNMRTAERINRRLRKSVERHGLRFVCRI